MIHDPHPLLFLQTHMMEQERLHDSAETVSSSDASNTDSGRGPSEEGDSNGFKRPPGGAPVVFSHLPCDGLFSMSRVSAKRVKRQTEEN